jgi:hypothetical protein
MQPIQIHPASLVVGLGIASLAFLAMAQAPVPNAPTQIQRAPPQFLAHPRDFVEIQEGVQFVVPAGKIFMLTAAGSRVYLSNPTHVLVNGVLVLMADASVAPDPSMREVARGLTVSAGGTIDVQGPVGYARAWGFLADA